VAVRAIIGVVAALIILGAAEVFRGRLSLERALILTGYMIFLCGFFALLAWVIARPHEQERPSFFRKALTSIALTLVASLVAYATVQLAPPWLVEILRKNPSPPRLSAPLAPASDLTQVPPYLNGSDLQGLTQHDPKAAGKP
jgi:uncharacterized PurR-regulated membrane protein YhhQ (DUF165 family)